MLFRQMKYFAAVVDCNSFTEAAEQCGFRDVHYFSRCFKAFHGISPGLYRRAPSRSMTEETDA